MFGASTPATATVLALFMGGLGLGAAWLGPRADRSPRPLLLYGRLELAIAIFAAASPLLALLVRSIYFGMGGAWTLGPLWGTFVQLLLSTVVLGVPAALMGGTLPAIVRAAGMRGEPGRRSLAVLYGLNTLGAVTGVLLATFFMLERLGTPGTLWAAASANALVALIALAWSKRAGRAHPELVVRSGDREPGAADSARRAPRRLVVSAAALAGFVFFLMEMIWYRMLTPLLGGTTFSFGVILAVALLGVGLGSLAHGALGARRPATARQFAVTCGLEALVLAIPFALGDRIAILTALLSPISRFDFFGSVVVWSLIAGIVVFPASLVAGYQFPLLVRLLGRDDRTLGGDTGRAYAWNTMGAIAGSLAGGFLLIPWLSALGSWRLSVFLMSGLCLATIVLAVRPFRASWGTVLALGVTLAAIGAMVLPEGPTGLWRHTNFGSRRIEPSLMSSWNAAVDQRHRIRRWVIAEADGRESSIAAHAYSGYSLIVGGKSDGNIIADAGTQVMCGMLGALLHPQPRRALVIGLGTGSTAGWLGIVPSMERVDVVELEPKVLSFASLCAAANHDVLRNPRVRVFVGDGREFVQTTRARYDLIVSEPSNPYRAGVASLYSQEFYRSASAHLTEDGMFLQWLQTYDADFETVRMVYTTLGTVFDHIESWSTLAGDLLLVASKRPVPRDVATLRARLASQPFGSAVERAWRVRDLEGVLAHYIGNAEFAASLAALGPRIVNTDARTALEYRFARAVLTDTDVRLDDLRQLAVSRGQSTPAWTGVATIDGLDVAIQRAATHVSDGRPVPLAPKDHPAHLATAAMDAFQRGANRDAHELWRQSGRRPGDLTQLAMAAIVHADALDPAAAGFIAELRAYRPVEADLLLARSRLALGDVSGAAGAYEAACLGYRADPWVWLELADEHLPLAQSIAERGGKAIGERMFLALSRPFSMMCSENTRLEVRLALAHLLDEGTPGRFTREAFDAYGDHPPWSDQALYRRAVSYARTGDPRAPRARRDLADFRARMPALLPARSHETLLSR